MYIPPAFAESRVDILHGLIRAHGLGTLVTLGSEGLTANHLLFEIAADPAPLVTLRAHVARANPVWPDFSPEVEALVIFQGPHAYITPNWYPTKHESGKVVPTFNYAVVHARGPIHIIEDAYWLRALVERLTDQYEQSRPSSWKVTDAPDEFVRKQLQAVVGIELPISRLIGKWKVSQNRPTPDREGVVEGLHAAGNPESIRMAEEVAKRGTGS